MEMQLNEREASLVDAFRRLPRDAATKLSALAERLAALARDHRIDWSDEDVNDFRAASLRRLDAEESGSGRFCHLTRPRAHPSFICWGVEAPRMKRGKQSQRRSTRTHERINVIEPCSEGYSGPATTAAIK